MKNHLLIILIVFTFLMLNSCGEASKSTPEAEGVKKEGNNKGLAAPEMLGEDKVIQKPFFMTVHKGRLYEKSDNIPEGVERITEADITHSLEKWQESKQPMLLYCHGGLVPEKKAFKKPIKDGLDSTIFANNLFPYYIIYDAGIGQVTKLGIDELLRKIKNGTQSIVNDGIFKLLKKRLQGLFVRKTKSLGGINKNNVAQQEFIMIEQLLDKSEDGLPDDLIEDVVDWENDDFDFTEEEINAFAVEFENELTGNYKNQSLKTNAISNDYQKANATSDMEFKSLLNGIKYFRMVKNIIKRYKNNRDHKFLLTLYEEFMYSGSIKIFKTINIVKLIKDYVKIVWKYSKKNVEMAFAENNEKAAGTNFIKRLADMEGDITLSGSSTGAIYVCEMIKKMKDIRKTNPTAFDKLTIKVELIVAACKFTLFQETFEHTAEFIDNENVLVLSLSDKKELSGSNWGWPIGSTLYLVSAIADSTDEYHDMPVLGMERYFIEKDKLKKLNRSEKEAIQYAYDYLDYDGDFPKLIFSDQPHKISPYLRHSGTRHVNLVKNKNGMQSMALFAKFGYNRLNYNLAELEKSLK